LKSNCIGDKRILIVDDQSYNIEACKIIMTCILGQGCDYMFAQAFNGKQALDLVVENVEYHDGK